MTTLTGKQERWCEEYLVDLNATQAAIRAGYSQKTAATQGYENLRKPYLMAIVAGLKQERSDKTEIDAAEVLRILSAQVLADPRDLYESDGITLKNVHDWPEGWRLLLVSLDASADGTVRAKFSDRARLVSLMGKHVEIGAFVKKIEVDAGDSLVDYLEQAARRLDTMRVPPSEGVVPDDSDA